MLQLSQPNVTFQNVKLLDVNAWQFETILLVTASNATFDGMESSGCNASNAVLKIQSQDSYTASIIMNSKFSNATTRGVAVQDSGILIANSLFDRHQHNGTGGAFYISSSSSAVQIRNCSFTNNVLPNETNSG